MHLRNYNAKKLYKTCLVSRNCHKIINLSLKKAIQIVLSLSIKMVFIWVLYENKQKESFCIKKNKIIYGVA